MSRRVTLSLAPSRTAIVVACEQGLTPARIPPEELFFSTVGA